MKSINATLARQNIYQLIKEVTKSSDPVMITSKSGNAYLVGADDWESLQETLYLLSVPGLREDIVEGMKAPLNEFIEEKDLEW